jgi:beta-glucosidase
MVITEEIKQKTAQILDQLTLKEKVYQTAGNLNILSMGLSFIRSGFKYNQEPYKAGGSKRFNVPPMGFLDGPRGVVSGHSTCFPVSMARGATWDIDLEERIGKIIGQEIRAHGGNFFGGVCINLLRHPGWGRAQETYGEDPFLLGEFGAALVRGVQHHNVMACAKHFAVNSMENARFKVNVAADDRTMHEVFLPHFKRCVDAGCASIMGAYNMFRGDHCCESSELLTKILRDQWRFEGFTISDFIWGIRDGIKAIQAGMNIEMPFVNKYGKNLVKAVKSGQIDEKFIDRAAFSVISTILRFTEAKDPQLYPKTLIGSDEGAKVAMEAAQKSMVLLKNENHILPLNESDIKTMAIIGKLSDVENVGDHGSSWVRPKYTITPLQGLKTLVGDHITILHSDAKNLSYAKKIAHDAEVVLIIAGNTHRDEGEFIPTQKGTGGDRDSLKLCEEEIALIQTIVAINPNTIVSLIAGSVITVEEWYNDVPAILMSWYSGQEGGTALAKIFFGHINPSGKLPFTVPQKEEDLPFFDKNAEEITYEYYLGYTLFDQQEHQARFPFGFGLSYTTFTYSNLRVNANEYSPTDTITISVDVSNTGDTAGDEVIQLYSGYENPSVERHHKDLRGFKRITLDPQESKMITFSLQAQSLAYYSPDSATWIVDPISYHIWVGPNADESQSLFTTFAIR